MRVVPEGEGHAEVAHRLGETDGDGAQQRRRDDRQHRGEGPRAPGAMDASGVLELGSETLQTGRDDEVGEGQRRGGQHDDDAQRTEELTVEPTGIDPEGVRGAVGLEKILPAERHYPRRHQQEQPHRNRPEPSRTDVRAVNQPGERRRGRDRQDRDQRRDPQGVKDALSGVTREGLTDEAQGEPL